MKVVRLGRVLLLVFIATLLFSVRAAAKTNPTITWSRPSAITYGTALSATQLDASASVQGTFVYSPAAGTVLTAGSQTLSVTFTPTDTTDYNTVSKNVTLTVNMVTVTITWQTPSPITYGTALSATQLDATTGVAGTFAYSPTAGTVLTAGTQYLSVNFTPNDSVDYKSANKQISLTVNPATPTISWPTPNLIIYGTALSATQLNASANVPGNFQYNPDFGTVLKPGAHTLSVSFNPTDNSDYSVTNATVSLSVSGVPPPDIITTVAGSGTAGYTGNGGQAFNARLEDAADVAVDLPGNMYIVDETNYVVREVAAATGIINNFAGSHAWGFTGDGGQATSAKLAAPLGIAVDAAGNVFIADTGNQVIRKVTASTGIISTVAGNHNNSGYSGDGGPATSAGLCDPAGLAIDSSGNLYIADAGNNVVRKVTAATGFITTVAGNGTAGYSGDGGLAVSAKLNGVAGVAIDGSGNLYIADTQNNVIREVAAATGIITTIAGNGTAGYHGDGGLATAAELHAPMRLALDSSGNLYIADSSNNVIREVVASSQIVITVAGNGTAGYAGDGGPAILAELSDPIGLAIDTAGDLYVGDEQNVVIRQVGTVINVTISPLSTALYGGQTYTFSSSVTGTTNSAVTWSINPPSEGSISSSGVYTAPTGISTQQIVTVTATSQADSTKFESAAVTLVPPVMPTITWATPAAFSYGAALGATQLDATVNAPGTLAYSPAAGTVLSAGTHTLTVTFTPANPNLYGPASATVTLTVNKATPTISWATPTAINYGTALSATQLDATANVAGTFAYMPAAGAVPAAGSQTLSVTFTPTDTSDYNTATGTVILTVNSMAETVTVTPATVSIFSGQTQQFAATVANSTNTAVTWSISPTSSGTITGSGLYVAPATMTAAQTVTVTAVSQANSSITGSATLTVQPALCPSNGYKFMRAIVIDHRQVANSDQVNFPFLFSSTDSMLANVANGGHVNNINGYDIVFTSDPAGQNRLNFEMEQYNPVTGQIIAWVRIPTLSHDTDTPIYLFYGNVNVANSQQNAAGVWDSNYVGVWHLPNGSTLSANDSTANGNNGSPGSGTSAAAGFIDGGASLNGTSAADISLPTSGNEWNFSGDMTLSAWIKTTGNGLLVLQIQNGNPLAYLSVGPTTAGGSSTDAVAYFRTNSGGVLVASGNTAVNDGRWHHVEAVRSTGKSISIYVDGILETTTSYTDSGLISDSGGTAKIGGGGTYAFNGLIDEARISKVARSSDWIATEYNNESSPATFYALEPENAESIVPNSVALYASQFEQFQVSGICNTGEAIWSMPAGSPGTLSANGLYSAPESIETQQQVTITGTTLGSTSAPLTATVTLLPSVAISVTPSNVSLYGGQSQQFAANISNASNTSVTWSISPAGIGSISASGQYTAPATIAAPQTITITATSQAIASASASATVTLVPPVVVSVSPQSSTLFNGETQQFTTAVGNAVNTSVTWSISPTGTGSITSTGLYTVPTNITTTQTLTVTATSVADPSKSASATIILDPTSCASNGYRYVRQIVINSSQVPNTDQTNFPFLFSSTDPLLATTSNGGHVVNPNGYDMIFSTDPAGSTALNYEVETYNPVTGQLVAWVRIPTLSHNTNTVVYLFYGNPSITASQQYSAGVWDSNYLGVYHLANVGSGVATDSTSNGNGGTVQGATLTTGEIDGAAGFSGSGAYIQLPQLNVSNTMSASAWFKTTTDGVIWGNNSGAPPYSGSFWNSILYVGSDSKLRGGLYNGSGTPVNMLSSSGAVNDGNWHFATYVSDGTTQFLYLDGQLQASAPAGGNTSSNYALGVGNTNLWADGNGGWFYFGGSIDEAKISTSARSADWIATEYHNQGSPSAFYTLSSEGAVVAPENATLFESQSQQFAAVGVCASGVTWSMPVGAPGVLTTSGLYTAPAVITEQQTLQITATVQGGSSELGVATITLMPPISVSVSPGSASLTANQTQQFTATVANTTDQSVGWTVSPAGTGTIDSNGVYTAPPIITTQQSVTITATSLQNSAQSASATVTLVPTNCASSGYGYQRVIVIDHTKVPNSDQTNFPFLFNTTDSDLASADNGGHVANPNGYDIFFSTDPNGATKLDHEVETYNPVTGQLVAWVRIPSLSHTTDTVLYVFYGNPNITASQQNPGGVWNSNYQAVYHLANVANGVASDSTNLANNGTLTSMTATTGEIDGAGAFNGASSFAQLPGADFPSYPTGVYNNLGLPATNPTTPFTASFGIWFKSASAGGILAQVPTQYCVYLLGECVETATQPGASDPGGWNPLLYLDDNGKLVVNGAGSAGLTTLSSYNDNRWHFAVVTYAGDDTDTLYVDGQSVGAVQSTLVGYSSGYTYFVGTAYTFQAFEGNWNWLYFNGSLDEVSVANSALSSDWIQTEYNNQSSPSTFYKFYLRSTVQVAPAAVSLYASQTQQFSVPGSCDAAVTFSIPSGAPGTVTLGGLYIAPGTILSAENVTVTASNSVSGTSVGSAAVTLLPPPPPINLAASAPSPYTKGTLQSFTATILEQDGTPIPGVTATFTVSGVNAVIGTATTDVNGVATYSYAGSNNGNDSILATASDDGRLLTSNALVASWVNPTPPTPAASITLSGPPALGAAGLMGAFTDNTGTVIEPVGIGASAQEFVVPVGATRLQLGVDSAYPAVDGGPGYVVAVNGIPIKVPPTATPWMWTAGGLNTNYQYGLLNPSIQNGVLDGTGPVIGASNLSAGQILTIVYQSGTASESLPLRPLVNANGDQSWITSTNEWQGTYFPTLYTAPSAYPAGQPISFTARVADSTGAPTPDIPVTLTVSGVNPGQYTATTDSTGTATFMYTGTNAGADSLVAQASPTGSTLTSSSSSVTWVNPTHASSAGSLALTLFGVVENVQGYTVALTDASGNPIPNASLGFYVWGVDNQSQGGTTDETGHAYFSYYHVNSGAYNVLVVATVNGNVIFSTVTSGVWTPPTTTNTCNNCNNLSVSIAAPTTVTMPNAIQLNGTVTDNVGVTPSVQWSQISGPGIVTFSNPQQAVTSATFSQIGTYVVQLYATDSGVNATAQFQVAVVPTPIAGNSQGWVGSPLYGSAVGGVVPITLASGVSLASGTLSYMPANDTNSVTVLNANVSGTGQIGVLDTTKLPNGAYWIQLQSTNTQGSSEYDLVLVNVSGNYKPGRVTSTVTDLVVPATGLAINIQRSYDSLNAGTSSDFGYGWSLSINVNLTVSPKGDVTFTLGGQRRTFYLTPQATACSPLVGCLFPYYFVEFTPEPGLHGTLTDSSPGCPLDIVIEDGSLLECKNGGLYNPPGYIYTDPNGTQYNISATGGLQSIQDRSGNGLTITPTGITSSTGLSVPFVRDDQNRITQIIDPQGNVYQYSYDTNGNLATVTYPNTSQPSAYTYDTNHYYLSGTDFRNNPLPSAQYYTTSDTDPAGNPLAGKLKSVTDSLSETTSYAYNLSTNTTTVTYPPDAGGNVGHATMVYDSLGDLLTSTDPLNHTTTNTYDANQNLLSTTDPLGHVTSYTYDSNGNKTSQTYPATATSTNTTSTTTYNQYSEPTTTTDEQGNVRSFSYDAYYNPATVTDGLGTLMSTLFNTDGTMQAGAIGYDITSSPVHASQFNYDANGNLASKTDALGRTTSYSYNALGQKVTMIGPIPAGSGADAATTTYQYDDFGHPTQTSAPLGRVTSSQYDGNGNKTSDTDARSKTTTYQYDNLNRLILTTYPDTTTANKTYDFRGNVVRETDQGGHVTLHQYDLAGRQVSVTQAYGTSNATTTTYGYDSAGRKTSETDALGHVTNYTYDAAGNLLSVAGVKGNFSYAYDNARNQVSMTDGNGNKTQYQYDARKRLTVTTYPDSTTKTNAYDGPGNLTSVTDQAGNVVQYTYDAANQLASVVQANSPNTGANTTIYGYDSNGNPILLEDANTHTTVNRFDVLSELTSKTLPDATLSETRTYDSNGNLSSVTHFSGVTSSYTYDNLNRLLSRTTPGETTVSHTYTSTGKYLTTTDASGTTNYTYDNMDRLATKATPEGTLNYTYDAAGHVASIASSNTNGASMSYTYDDLSRLSAVTDNRLALTTTYTYDNANNVATVAYPNGVQALFSYDSLNRVSTLATSQTGYGYLRGPTGNLTGATESNGRTVSWSYDGIYRLTNETITLDPSHVNGSVNYGLDPVGNRLSDTSSLTGVSSGSWGFNADDEVSSESYDQNGNVLAAGGKTFTYDSQNELVSMGSTASLVYDADGNRVAKSVSGVVTRYLVDDLNPTGYPQVMDELNGSGVVTRTYTYGLQRIDEEQLVSSTWTPSFYGYDGGGNVRQLTNSSGAITDTYEYDAYGNSFTVSGSTPNEFMYRGEQYDPDLGLYYLRARYYNPLTGRFMSRDPDDGKTKDPQSLHKYLYAQGDPINGIDPHGRDAIITYALSIGEKAPGILALELSDIAVNKVLECVAAWLAIGFGQEYAWFACYDVPF